MARNLRKQEGSSAGDESRITNPTDRTQAVASTRNAVRLPLTFLIDCSFNDLMLTAEIKSLSSQITRCYADNQKSTRRVHLAVSSFDGALKERFEGTLSGQYRNWKGVRFIEEDFNVATEQAKSWMKVDLENLSTMKMEQLQNLAPEYAKSDSEGPVIYLSSDASETLTELEPHGVYIIGGLVDKNRHKGICHRKAMEGNVRTAKLPIGEYMQMNSRSVLTVNHVVEILLRWLEVRDWGRAFVSVMPTRKGGILKARPSGREDDTDDVSDRSDQNEQAANAVTDTSNCEGSVSRDVQKADFNKSTTSEVPEPADG